MSFQSLNRVGRFGRRLHTPQRKVLMALKLLVKGLSLRATAEVLEVKLDTVCNWLRKAAQHSEAVSRMLIHSQVQLDELWTFVKKNTKIPMGGQPEGAIRAIKGGGDSLSKL